VSEDAAKAVPSFFCERWLEMITLVATALRSLIPIPALDPHQLQLGPKAGEGTFGLVRWGAYKGTPCVVKQAKPGCERADSYLRVEEHASSLLAYHCGDSVHFAPYVGAADKDGTKMLVWRACGDMTLGDYLRRGQPGIAALAEALECTSEKAIGRKVLREQLIALSRLHACGLVHRDIKPDNWIVDTDERCLRLIDFGSSCEVASWGTQRGYTPTRVPCSILFCPPEQLLTIATPYTYDVFSAALVWLCVALPALGESEETLYMLRMSIKEHGHRLDAWRASWEGGEPPVAQWRDESIFGSTSEQAQKVGWELLVTLLAPAPHERPTAAEALLSPFMNADCALIDARMPAPRPWTLEGLAHAGAVLSGAEPQRRLVAHECTIDPS
jgi:hypothetical protein